MKNSNDNSKHSLLKKRRNMLQRMAAVFTFGGLLSPLASKAANVKKSAATASVSSVPFLGEIIMFGGHFAPEGWAFCDGQILAINSNQALFSLLGTIYGGDGETTFGLPDLRGRVPMHHGNGPGLTARSLGQKSGTETNTLTINNLPAHAHPGSSLALGAGSASSTIGANNSLAASTSSNIFIDTPPNTAAKLEGGPVVVASQGGGTSVNNMQPYQAVSFIIAIQGVYPSTP